MISNELMINLKGFFYLIVICIFLSGTSEILIMSCINYYKTNNLKIPPSPVYFYYRDLDKTNIPLNYILYSGITYIVGLCILSPIFYLLHFSFVPKSYFKDKDFLILISTFSIAFFFYFFLYDINTIKLPSDEARNQYLNKLQFSFFH